MSMNRFPDEHIVLNLSTAGADAFTGSITYDVVNFSEFNTAYFIIDKTSGAVGTFKFTPFSADDIVPTTTENIAKFYYRSCKTSDTSSVLSAWTATTAGVTVTAGAHEIWEFMVKAEDCYPGYEYIFCTTTEIADEEVSGGVTLILADGRYGQDIHPEALT